ncbi:O-antigen ligase family protein [Sporomusa sphaeroides]|uniref:O-antigen ligase family protein n=1 Tax=Sporomusa sphaeroides TaxID=47679 RepID=UPI003DA13FA8
MAKLDSLMVVPRRLYDNAFVFFIGVFAFLAPVDKQMANTALILSTISFLFLLRKYKVDWSSFFKQPLVKPLGYFFAALFVSVIFSTDVLISVREYLRMITYVLPFLFFAILNNCSHSFTYDIKKTGIHAYMLGCTIAGLYAIYQYWATGQLGVSSFYGNRIIFASFMEMVLPLLAVFLIEQPDYKKKSVYFIMGCICLITLMLTQARGPWLGVGSALFVMMIAMRKNIYENKKSYIAVAVLMLVLLTVVSPLYLERAKTLTDLNFSTNYQRISIWEATIPMIQDYPLTGVGLGKFAEIYNEQYYNNPLYKHYFWIHAHNSYLMYAAENGIVNLLAFVYLLFSIGKSLLDQKGDTISIGVFSVVFAIAASSMVDDLLWAPYLAKILWLFIGIALYNPRIQEGPCLILKGEERTNR